MAVAPLFIKLSRGLYIDYLPPVAPYEIGLYIPRIGDSENFNFTAFLQIFSDNLWIFILLSAIVIAGIKLLFLYWYGSVRIFIDTVAFFWTSFIVYFGGKPTNTAIDSKRPYKILIFSSLLGGVIIWIYFRSRLTAELSVVLKKYPFNDMESFSETDWR